jgi:DNA helicase-2/ATP-dependent DNA helicase PcrA
MPTTTARFARVVNFPARGIGARTVEQLQDAARMAKSQSARGDGAVGAARRPPSPRSSTG